MWLRACKKPLNSVSVKQEIKHFKDTDMYHVTTFENGYRQVYRFKDVIYAEVFLNTLHDIGARVLFYKDPAKKMNMHKKNEFLNFFKFSN